MAMNAIGTPVTEDNGEVYAISIWLAHRTEPARATLYFAVHRRLRTKQNVMVIGGQGCSDDEIKKSFNTEQSARRIFFICRRSDMTMGNLNAHFAIPNRLLQFMFVFTEGSAETDDLGDSLTALALQTVAFEMERGMNEANDVIRRAEFVPPPLPVALPLPAVAVLDFIPVAVEVDDSMAVMAECELVL